MIQAVCQRLLSASNALAVLLVSADGTPITSAGNAEHIAAGAMSRSIETALSKLRSAPHTESVFERTEKVSVLYAPVPAGAMLLVVFDDRTSLGLVRLRVKKAAEDLARSLASGPAGSGSPPPAAPPAEGGAAPAEVADDRSSKASPPA